VKDQLGVVLPSIVLETAISYVRRNRADYTVPLLAAPNTTVLQKRAADRPDWGSFIPFPVAQRKNWSSAV
jgi:hypothetical protein